MDFRFKKIAGLLSVIISAVIVAFYLEGFLFYSFKENLGFIFSLFFAPMGLILGYISRSEDKFIKFFGFYGNIIVISFCFLYWPIGYIIELFIK